MRTVIRANSLRISIVLPVRNELASIDRYLAALLTQDVDPEDLEILVVDGRSSDGTRERVQSWLARDQRIRLLDNPAKITPTALNIGIISARGQTIARMDGHTEAPRDYLARGLAALERTGAWCVGGQMRRVGSTPLMNAISAVTMSPFGVGDAAHNYAAQSRSVETVFLGMWPRWVFERVGLFDPELVRNQDDEMSFRIREAGGRIWLDQDIVLAYEPRDSLRRLFSQYRQYGMWKVRVFQMHPGAARWRHFVPAAWVGSIAAGLAIAPFAAIGIVVAAGAFASYLIMMMAAAVRLSNASTAPRLVLASLFAMHTGYGIGFWQGLIRFAPRWFGKRAGNPPPLPAASDS